MFANIIILCDESKTMMVRALYEKRYKMVFVAISEGEANTFSRNTPDSLLLVEHPFNAKLLNATADRILHSRNVMEVN